jgi:hypothetical protein
LQHLEVAGEEDVDWITSNLYKTMKENPETVHKALEYMRAVSGAVRQTHGIHASSEGGPVDSTAVLYNSRRIEVDAGQTLNEQGTLS